MLQRTLLLSIVGAVLSSLLSAQVRKVNGEMSLADDGSGTSVEDLGISRFHVRIAFDAGRPSSNI